MDSHPFSSQENYNHEEKRKKKIRRIEKKEGKRKTQSGVYYAKYNKHTELLYVETALYVEYSYDVIFHSIICYDVNIPNFKR